MKKYILLIGAVVILVSLVLIFSLFFLFLRNAVIPPKIGVVQKQLENNYDDISSIIGYLATSKYDNIYIYNHKKEMLADLTWMPIDSSEISATITRLFESGYCIQISKIGNTICFLQWKGIRDIGCGVAYSINGIDLPEIQYVTELTPISYDGWYYYVTDYNKARV